MQEPHTVRDAKKKARPLRPKAGTVELSKRNGQMNGELNQLLDALHAMRSGDFSVRISNHNDGIIGKIADAINDIVLVKSTGAHTLVRE